MSHERRIFSAGDLLQADIKEPPRLVHGLIPGGTVTVLAGQHKTGKTILLLQLAMCVASGQEWLWWQTNQGRVLYLNYEVATWSWRQRLEKAMNGFTALHDRHVRAEVGKNLHVTSLPDLRINRPPDVKLIASKVDELNARLLVIDPVRVAYTGDRNDDREVDRVLTMLNEQVVEPTGVSVVLAHHMRKPAAGAVDVGSTWDIKGSGSWSDGADQVLTLRHDRADKSHRGRQLNATLRHYEGFEDRKITLQPASMLFATTAGTTEAGPTESDKLKEAFTNSLTGDLSIRDIAAVLDISEDAAYKRWQRGGLDRVRKTGQGSYEWEDGTPNVDPF